MTTYRIVRFYQHHPRENLEAVRLANQVEVERKKREAQPQVTSGYTYAPDKLPKRLPIGTRLSTGNDSSTSVLDLQYRHGRTVYFGDWESGSSSFYPARDIDWEHLLTLDPLPEEA